MIVLFRSLTSAAQSGGGGANVKLKGKVHPQNETGVTVCQAQSKSPDDS